ncbi:hypothetical protein OH76DRAFT_1348340 [Lentinus brumalis]|uniref:Uncharacterized protein n=1 Tax=Lentinus brumalis TaxID=2498619 RepID=A0A371DDS6_9APHY|nr:hypothetical protein OH76DRAFT_1348340 [Polyporus brumalis]
MPVNTTVSHVSPLISYIPRSAWFEGSSGDPNLGNYSLKSYHATNNTEAGNASVVFSWWGTGESVHGGYRRRLGGYTVTLDSDVTLHQGYVDGTDEDFDAVLFNATGLPAGPHQLRITNASNDVKRPVFDIDHLVFESNLEETEIVSHMSADCTWFPKGDGAWEVDERSQYVVVHVVTQFVFSPRHTGFILYGQLDGTSAPLTVTLDGRSYHPVAPNTAITPLLSTSHVLFAVTDLNQGNHTIWVENNPADSNTTARRMDMAYGRILSLPNDSSFSHGGSM